MVGKTLGKYRLVETLGRGGMGTVYRAIDETLDRDVAIKILNPELVEGEGARRFRAEAVALARLNHPRIAHVYELCREGDHFLMVMEYVRGETFEQLITRSGPLPIELAVGLTVKVLDALQHAHAAGIIHRDLKPGNLMVVGVGPATGDVKVMDFGIARVSGTEHMTSEGFMMGTPAYMAPEQVRGQEVDARTDLYAMGVVLYRMATAHLPFRADTAVAMIQSQLNDQPTPSRIHRADLPDWLEAVLTRALAKEPSMRFQSAEDLRQALQLGLTGSPTLAYRLLTPTNQELAPTMPATPTPVQVRVASGAVPKLPPTGTAPAPPPVAGGHTTIMLQKQHLAGAAALLGLLIVAVVVLAFAVLRNSRSAPAAPPQTAASAPPPASVSAPPPASVSAPPPAAAASSPTPTPAPVDASPTPAAMRAAAPPSPSAGPDARRTPAARPAESPSPRPGPSAAPKSPAPARPTLPAVEAPLSFSDVKLVLTNGGKTKENDAIVALRDGTVSVVAEKGGAVIASMPYRAVLSATYGREKAFLRSKHLLTLRSRSEAITLRIDKKHLDTLLPAIEARTGVKVQAIEK